MPVETLYVGPLSNATDTDPAAAYPRPSSPTIVGPEPILSDGSNATYAHMVDQFDISGSLSRTETHRDFAKGKLDVLSVDSSRATLNSIEVVTIGAGISWDTTQAPAVAVDLYDPASWDSYWGWLTLWQSAGYTDPTNPGDITYVPGDWGSSFAHPDTGLTFTAAEMLDFLASGNAYIRALALGNTDFVPGSYTASGRIYEFRVVVDYTLIQTTPARLRLYPQKHTRLWPKPGGSRPGKF